MLEPGRVLGRRYEIIEEIGSGGMAVVYKAKDYTLSRMVAIKVLKEELALDETILGKFKKEALAAGSLTHPNIVAVYDLGHEIGCDYIVMEYIDGITLKEYIKRRDVLSSEEILKISIKIAEALKVAHAGGIIHRDIKPGNIMVTPSGDVKVTDFGIAKAADSKTVTGTGETLGSVHYLSPEQARGYEVDVRSDLYSLGITMYEMATKELPFVADTPVAVALKQVHDPMPDPLEKAPQIWPGLRDIILKLTQKRPEFRYQSADELIRDLKHLYRSPNYRLRNDTIGVTNYGKTTTQIKLEEERERQRQVREREERMRKVKRKNRWVIILSILGVIALLTLLFLGLRLLQKTTNFLSDESSSEIVIQESSQAEESSAEESLETRYVPNVVGITYESAQTVLNQAGIYYKVESVFSDTEAGYVVEQSPEAETELNDDTTITLYVSKGPEQVYVKVPNLYGMTVEEAKKALESVGLMQGEITQDYGQLAEGLVMGQGTAYGLEVEESTSVDFTISLGPYENTGMTKSGTVTISQPFTKADESGKLVVIAYDSDGEVTKIYENKVSYSTFSSLDGEIKVNYPAGTIRVEASLDDTLILSQDINE